VKYTKRKCMEEVERGGGGVSRTSDTGGLEGKGGIGWSRLVQGLAEGTRLGKGDRS